ncbi:MAG TPA: hypothetical protein VGD64_00010 [Acidisarcina sp.]
MKKVLIATGLLMSPPLAFGQGPQPVVGKHIAVPSERFPADWYPKENGMNATAPIAGAPYSATMTMTTTLLNGEGKPMGTSSWRTLMWRDSAGRLREEEMLGEVLAEQQGHPDAVVGLLHQITAVDTVHHCQFTWSAPLPRGQNPEAVVNCDSLEVSRTDDSHANQLMDPKPDIVHEQMGTLATTTTKTPLGKRTMQGLEVVGVRSVTTEVDAEGRQQGTKEVEIWWSPALYESILSTVKTGQNIITMEMTEIKRDEPDAGLFYPPKGYLIRKELEVPPLPVPPQP